MKRTALTTLIAVFSLSAAQAQGTYFGLSYTGLVAFSEEIGIGYGYLGGLQLGGPVAGGFELRGTLETIVVASIFGVDLLHPFTLSTATRGYVGGGADFIYSVYTGRNPDGGSLSGSSFGLHGTAGLESRASRALGFYGEVQPYFPLDRTLLDSAWLTLKFRTGFNFYF